MGRASSHQNYVSALYHNALIYAFAFELRYVHKANTQISLKKASTKRMDLSLRVRPYVSAIVMIVLIIYDA